MNVLPGDPSVPSRIGQPNDPIDSNDSNLDGASVRNGDNN